jgi:hypothetical protein
MIKRKLERSLSRRTLVLIPACLASLAAAGCNPHASANTDDQVSQTSAALTTLTISGVVTGPGGPLSGATVAMTGGATLSALTDATGKYSFSVSSGETYTVTATLAGCAFSAPQTFTRIGVNHTANFTGTGSSCVSGGSTGSGGSGGTTGSAGSGGTTGSAGSTGAGGSCTSMCTQGPPGPQGPAGPQGPTGPQGPPGVAGPTGAQGPAGVAGPKGATGAQGPQGITGAVGATGARGATGPQGPAGITNGFQTFETYPLDTPGNLTSSYTSFAQLVLPAGAYLISATVQIGDADPNIPATVFCLVGGAVSFGGDIPTFDGTTFTNTAILQMNGSTNTVQLQCVESDRGVSNPNVSVQSALLNAVQVQNFTSQ